MSQDEEESQKRKDQLVSGDRTGAKAYNIDSIYDDVYKGFSLFQ